MQLNRYLLEDAAVRANQLGLLERITLALESCTINCVII